MIKYEIKKNSTELKSQEYIKTGCTLDQADQDPEIMESFKEKLEALEALKKYKSQVDKLSGGAGTYYGVTEFYIEQNEYDEEGEWCSGGEVWDFAEFETNQEKNIMYK